MLIKHEKIDYSLTAKKMTVLPSGLDHWHQRAEFVYVIEGECWIKVGKQKNLCRPGDVAFIQSGEIHAIWSETKHLLYVFTFDPGMFYRILPEFCFPRHFISAQDQQKAGLDAEISNLFYEIYREKEEEKPLYEALMRADILRLYSILTRYFEDDSPRDEKTLARVQQFQTVLEFITSHYAEHITLADIAEVINYTPSYVSTLFVTFAGINFKAYLDNFRVKKAADLLCSTHQTVTDIALQCGYENVRTFNNAFRRVTGQAPSRFRKSNF